MNPDEQGIESDDFKTRVNRTRALILEAATPRPTSLAEIARELGEPVAKVAYHARVLRDAGALRVMSERKPGGGVAHSYVSVGRAIPEGE